MDDCQVEARFSPSGDPRPLKIWWQNSTLIVTDVGRRWREVHIFHCLVKSHDGRTFELQYDGQNWQCRTVSGKPFSVV